MKRFLTSTALVYLGIWAGLAARQAAEPVDAAMNAKIRDEGLNRSQIGPVFDEFVDVIGPRLTASPAHKRAADFARDTLVKWGLTNAHLESFDFGGRGWEMEKVTIEMVEPRYMPLVGYPEAWTPSTPGELVVPAVLTAGKTPDEIAQMPIAGAAVLAQPVVSSFITQDREQPTVNPNARIGAPAPPRQGGAGGRQAGAGGRQAGAPGAAAGRGAGRGAANAAYAKAAVLIKPSLGLDTTVFVQAQNRDTPDNTLPAIVLAGEHYNMVARLLERGIPVKLRVNVQTKFFDDHNSYNVIAEIPGTDPVLKDQVVMLGGHLDSWHTGTGATDNADGAATVMEALRILKSVGAQPKRTIRIGVWGGEEEGLLGSKAWVHAHLEGDEHKAARDNLDVYFNIDPGYGPIYGWYLEDNEAVKPIFDAWLEPFKDLGAVKNVMPKIGSTDHLSFTAVGVPGFNPIQSYVDYDTRLHHTNGDVAERIKLDDLKQNAIVMASFAYQAAMRPAMIPSPLRKP